MVYRSVLSPLSRPARLRAALYRVRLKNTAAKKSVPVSDLSAHAFGSITFAANPVNGATITLGGTVITFGSTITIGSDLIATLVNLLAVLTASADTNLIKCSYSVVGAALYIRSKTPGASTFTLAASVATVSHSPLRLPVITKRVPL